MPSVAIVVNSYPCLSESFILNKTILLSKSGYEVTVIAHRLEGDGPAYTLPDNITIVHAPSAFKSWGRYLHLAGALLQHPLEFLALLKTSATKDLKSHLKLLFLFSPFAGKKFEIVHFTFSGLGVSYLPVLPFLKNKSAIYVSCRGHAEQVRPLIADNRKDSLRSVFEWADRVHCVSADIVNTCKSYGLEPNKAFINRPAIDPGFFSAPADKGGQKPKDGVRLITVGRLHWKKSHETLLQAAHIVHGKGIKIHVDIVGDGNEKEKSVFLAHLLGIADCITFHGKKQPGEIQDLLTASDIYVHTSVSEGISNAVMEAMAMELPVISTNVGGMGELICDGSDGLLVPALDPEAVADQILLLANDGALRKKLGQSARQKILKEFTLERQCAVYVEEYSRYLANSL